MTMTATTMIATLAINWGRTLLAVIVPVAVYAGQTACDVWAEKAKKTGKRKRQIRRRRRR